MKLKTLSIFCLLAFISPSIKALNVKQLIKAIKSRNAEHPSLPRVQDGPRLAQAYYEGAWGHLTAAFLELKKDPQNDIKKLHFENAIKYAHKCDEYNHPNSQYLLFIINRYKDMYNLDNTEECTSVPPQEFTEAMWHFLQGASLKIPFSSPATESAITQEIVREIEYYLKVALELLINTYNSGYSECFPDAKLAHKTLRGIQTLKAQKFFSCFWPCEGMQKWEDAMTAIKAKEFLK